MAADVLGFERAESRLVYRILESLHPQVKAHLMFATKQESAKDLFTLVTTEAEAIAVEEQSKSLTTATRWGGVLSGPPQ
jgi:hypothetical protein